MVYKANPARSDQPTDPRRHADDVLARARTRDCRVITLDTAGSPADCASTVVLPRYRVTSADPDAVDPDSTQALPTATPRQERR